MKLKNLLLCLLLIFTISTVAFSQEATVTTTAEVTTTSADNYKTIENDLVSVEDEINQMIGSGNLTKNSEDSEKIITLLNEIQNLLTQGNTEEVNGKLEEINDIISDGTTTTDDTTTTPLTPIVDATTDTDESTVITDATITAPSQTEDTTAPTEPPTTEIILPKYYVVREKEPFTDCLWRIASYSFVYNDSKYWKLLYNANKNIIKDPDLIYPGQILEISSLNGEKRHGTYTNN